MEAPPPLAAQRAAARAISRSAISSRSAPGWSSRIREISASRRSSSAPRSTARARSVYMRLRILPRRIGRGPRTRSLRSRAACYVFSLERSPEDDKDSNGSDPAVRAAPRGGPGGQKGEETRVLQAARLRQHPRDSPDGRRRHHDPFLPRQGPEARRELHRSRFEGFLRRNVLSPRHSGFHDPGRRPEHEKGGRLAVRRRRKRRQRQAGHAEVGIQRHLPQARDRLDGALVGPQLRVFAVLHRREGLALPGQPVHGLRRGRLRHGRGRQDRLRGAKRAGSAQSAHPHQTDPHLAGEGISPAEGKQARALPVTIPALPPEFSSLTALAVRTRHEPVACEVLPGDVGRRRYVRLTLRDNRSVLGVVYPEEEADSRRRWNAARVALRGRIKVPLLIADDQSGNQIVEDFGPMDLATLLLQRPEERGPWLARAVAAGASIAGMADPGINAPFDAALFRRELDLAREAVFDLYLRQPLAAPEREAHDRWADSLAREIAAHPRALCHRDFHGNNLFPSEDQVAAIDFQDMRAGPDTYDLASPLWV